jgi:hypothetical protein
MGGVVKVLGNDGRPRASIDVDNDGGVVKVQAHNGQAETLMLLESGGKNGMFLVRNTNGKNIVDIGGDQYGGLCTLLNGNGKTQVGLYSGVNNVQGGLLNIFAPNGKVVGALGSDKNGRGAFDLRNSDSKTQILIDINDQGGVFELLNPEGKSQLGMWAGTKDSKGALVNLRGPTSDASVILDAGFDGSGSLTLRNNQKHNLIFCGPDKTGAGIIDIRAADNTSRVLIGLDPNGVGGIDCKDAQGQLKGRFPN